MASVWLSHISFFDPDSGIWVYFSYPVHRLIFDAYVTCRGGDEPPKMVNTAPGGLDHRSSPPDPRHEIGIYSVLLPHWVPSGAGLVDKFGIQANG